MLSTRSRSYLLAISSAMESPNKPSVSLSLIRADEVGGAFRMVDALKRQMYTVSPNLGISTLGKMILDEIRHSYGDRVFFFFYAYVLPFYIFFFS